MIRFRIHLELNFLIDCGLVSAIYVNINSDVTLQNCEAIVSMVFGNRNAEHYFLLYQNYVIFHTTLPSRQLHVQSLRHWRLVSLMITLNIFHTLF